MSGIFYTNESIVKESWQLWRRNADKTEPADLGLAQDLGLALVRTPDESTSFCPSRARSRKVHSRVLLRLVAKEAAHRLLVRAQVLEEPFEAQRPRAQHFQLGFYHFLHRSC